MNLSVLLLLDIRTELDTQPNRPEHRLSATETHFCWLKFHLWQDFNCRPVAPARLCRSVSAGSHRDLSSVFFTSYILTWNLRFVGLFAVFQLTQWRREQGERERKEEWCRFKPGSCSSKHMCLTSGSVIYCSIDFYICYGTQEKKVYERFVCLTDMMMCIESSCS